MKNDIFISYRRKDGIHVAHHLYDRLKERGLSCYFDLENDRSGNFDEALYEAIAESKNFVLVLNKGSLVRCLDENDWVRKEILKAIELKKNIVPVLVDGFSWKEEVNSSFPAEIYDLNKRQSVEWSHIYLRSSIDKIINYCYGTACSYTLENAPIHTCDFFKYVLNSWNNAKYVDMAFHAGADWMRKDDHLEILDTLLSRGLQMRIIINSTESVENASRHMRHPTKKYVEFEQSYKEWANLAEKFPNLITIKKANVQLMHRLYIIRADDGKGACNVKYYTYGNYKASSDYRATFTNCDDMYKLYYREFEYVWEKATEV